MINVFQATITLKKKEKFTSRAVMDLTKEGPRAKF